MGFSKMLELLQNKNKGKIILCNAGEFYIARGKDAVLLNKEIGLKLTCLETEICKVGFPKIALDKYCKLIEEKQYGYIVYNYDNKKNELEEIKIYQGKKKNPITENRACCFICAKTTQVYKKTDKYIEAVKKLYEKEEAKKEKI